MYTRCYIDTVHVAFVVIYYLLALFHYNWGNHTIVSASVGHENTSTKNWKYNQTKFHDNAKYMHIICDTVLTILVKSRQM